MKKIITSVCLIAISVVACKTTEKPAVTATAPVVPTPPKMDCTTAGITYAKDIKPIMDAYCTSCHNYGETGGVNLMLIEDVKKAATKGELLGTVKHERGFPRMPANAEKMSNDLISKIECWISSGMKD